MKGEKDVREMDYEMAYDERYENSDNSDEGYYPEETNEEQTGNTTTNSNEEINQEEKEKKQSKEYQKRMKSLEIIYGAHYSQKNPRYLGNCFCFGYKNNRPTFTIGPDYKFYLGLNLFVLPLAAFCLIFVISKTTFTGTIVGIIILFAYFASYTLTFLINPGIPDRKLSQYDANHIERIRNNKKKYCKICNIVKDETKDIKHCEDCNVCVEEFDHHCPWTGKCIGGGNKTFFYMFIAFLMILFMYLMAASMICWHIMIFQDRKTRTHKSS